MFRFIPILLLSAVGAYCSINTSVAIAPALDAPMLETTLEDDLFVSAPAYGVNHPRQVIRADGWTGPADYGAQLRACWNKDGLFFRIDISDEDNQAEGDKVDSITLLMRHASVGPSKTVLDAWQVVLTPNVEEEYCGARVVAPEAVLKLNVGEPITQFLRTVDGYSILVQLDTSDWDSKPRRAGTMLFQAQFQDVDAADKSEHKFALFAAGPEGKVRSGRLALAGKTWSSVHAATVVQGDHTAEVLVDYGNLSNEDVEVTVSLTGKDLTDDQKSDRERPIQVTPGTVSQAEAIKIDLKGLPSGSYEVFSKLSFSPGADRVRLRYDAASGMVFLPRMLTRRAKKSPSRELAILDNRMMEQRAFSYMAGAGKVLWSVGQYDNSSRDFKESLKLPGERRVTVPTATKGEIPWALFGGGDTLDGMAEPFVLRLSDDLGVHEPKLQPFPKLVEKNEIPKARDGALFKRLLLLGISVTNFGAEPAVLRVRSSQAELIPETKLEPPADGKPHCYVYRIWISDADREIRIENTSQRGSYFEIDFIALLGGNASTGYGFNQPEIHFSGSDEAEHFTRQLYTSLFFMRHYMVDREGTAYRSLPGGLHGKASRIDHALLLNELASWGGLPEAKQLLRPVPSMISQPISHLNLELTAAQPLLVLGIYNVWRKLGLTPQELATYWAPCVQQPISQMLKVAAAHPHGLLNATGEFGAISPDLEGFTRPVCSTVTAAIDAASEIARNADRGIVAGNWMEGKARIEKNIDKFLVSQSGGTNINSTNIFPAAHGLPQIATITTDIPEKLWLYGWFEDDSPVCYTDTIRTFDTPYLFAGEAFGSYRKGFAIPNEQHRRSYQKTFEHMLNTSLVFGNTSWQHATVMGYKSTDLHLWTALSAVMLENREWATKAINGFVRYTYDEFIPIRVNGPNVAACEISPFTFEERLNVGRVGHNLGATGDDLNIRTATAAMQVARAIAGVDDHDRKQLRLTTRLPSEWTKVEVSNWNLGHDFEEEATARLNYYSYEKLADDRYTMAFDCDDRVRSVVVRFGPFSPRIRKVQIASSGRRMEVATYRSGENAWAEWTFKKVKNLDLIAQAVHF